VSYSGESEIPITSNRTKATARVFMYAGARERASAGHCTHMFAHVHDSPMQNYKN